MVKIKYILFSIFVVFYSTSLFAYSDFDMDGVEDKDDRCPNTPFMELVDINGCTTEYLISPHHFDLIVGVDYADSDYLTLNKTNTISSTLQIDYYYNNFSLQLSSAYYSTDGDNYSDSGIYDTFIGGAYQFSLVNSLLLRVGIGAILPTYKSIYDNNNIDYTASLNLSYNIDKINLFGGYSYTIIGDDDLYLVDENNNSVEVIYNNTSAFSIGAGYYMNNKVYISGSYNCSNSIYDGVEDIKTASLYGYYSFSENWFSTLSYAYGISDSASQNYVSLKVGYYY